MADVTIATVEHVATLARLSLTREEKETFARQLQHVLSYAESIQALDTSDVEPMSHAGAEDVFRPDEPRPGVPRARALEAAPDPAGPFFRVPRVIGG
jgi:aspartyl-tRNA(Asn)/glutamyl-tRNA(Gln) amidotransferase subunit C